eukprot:GEMP01003025.1.p1 GENE.GEMP01003025.1~~GEMP01003025.1.p1  ORF type:complete len:558 (+),score=60.52 GEMP01003025.1:57-1730(+)
MPPKRPLPSECATPRSAAKRPAVEFQGTPIKYTKKSGAGELRGTPVNSTRKILSGELHGTLVNATRKILAGELQGTPIKSTKKASAGQLQGTPIKSTKKASAGQLQGTPAKSAKKSVPRDESAKRDRPTGVETVVRKAAPVNPFRAYYWPTGTAMKLPGRQDHLIKVWNFLKDGHKTLKGKTAYCYGKPGTGKTLTAEYAAKIFCMKYKIPFASINCIQASLASNAETLRRIYQSLHDKLPGNIKKHTARRPARNILKSIAQVVQSLESPMVLILDEVDALDTNHSGQNLLSQVWSLPSNGPLMIISIANTLDLWLRHKRKVTGEIMRLNFLPYNHEECLEILTVRAKEANRDLSVFTPKALDILIRVVNNQEGDFRRILDICDQLSHGATKVIPQDVFRICGTTLRNNFANDFTASIKRLTLERKLALYCFGHTAFAKATKKKAADAGGGGADAAAGDASAELTVDELMSRFESIKSKLLVQNARLSKAIPKRAMTRIECSLVLSDLVNECLLEEMKVIGKKIKPKPGKEIYRLLFPVDKVQKVLQKELMEHDLLN